MTQAPPAAVLDGFGVAGEPESLDGGQGTAWVCGDLVFKPTDLPLNELVWQAELLDSIVPDGFRVARYARALDGALVVQSWCATERLEGRHEPRRWAEIVRAGDRFHASIAGIPRPPFLDERTDVWAIGDRVAWDELGVADVPPVKHVDRLASLKRPVSARPQLIHGDLGGNVLFKPGLPPAVIDFSPYFRPSGFAAAVVVADALCWEGADERLLDAVSHIPEFPQLLVRALIYRAVTDRLARIDEPWRNDDADPYLAPVELAERMSASEERVAD